MTETVVHITDSTVHTPIGRAEILAAAREAHAAAMTREAWVRTAKRLGRAKARSKFFQEVGEISAFLAEI